MKTRGGRILAGALQEKTVARVFTLSGGFCSPAPEDFMECGIPVPNAPREQTAGHLADGFARIRRQPAACPIGPGGFADAVAAPLAGYSVAVSAGERISEFVGRAWKIALSGWPGAAHPSLPLDIPFGTFEADAVGGLPMGAA